LLIDTKTFCLKIYLENKIKNWSLYIFCDNDWAGDSEKRIRLTGFIIYLMNVLVCWRLKAQRGVTFSSRKAEYVANLEAVKEIKFIYYLLREIGIVKEYVEEGIINIHFVKSIENISDVFMKNVSQYIYDKHVTKFLEVHAEEHKH
jgi:hypothetical protein